MPGGDGTGPYWARGNWFCRRGRGFGQGRGAGRGFGMGFGFGRSPEVLGQNVPYSNDEEKQDLKQYLEGLKNEIKEVEKRLKELKK